MTDMRGLSPFDPAMWESGFLRNVGNWPFLRGAALRLLIWEAKNRAYRSYFSRTRQFFVFLACICFLHLDFGREGSFFCGKRFLETKAIQSCCFPCLRGGAGLFQRLRYLRCLAKKFVFAKFFVSNRSREAAPLRKPLFLVSEFLFPKLRTLCIIIAKIILMKTGKGTERWKKPLLSAE